MIAPSSAAFAAVLLYAAALAQAQSNDDGDELLSNQPSTRDKSVYYDSPYEALLYYAPGYYYEKRAAMGFQGVRGKKAYYGDKRAPMQGLQGVRGKKKSSLVDEALDEWEKRAMLGFHGMRGKKDSYEPELLDDDGDGYLDKRAMAMGFHGMRGKRSTSDLGYRYYEPTRGKKNPRWALHGKFVGVRGKKWMSQESPNSRLVPLSYLDQLEAMDELERTMETTWH